MPQTTDYQMMHRTHQREFGRRVYAAKKCLTILSGHLQFESLIDHGCGVGAWLHGARDIGVSRVHGLEGHWIVGAMGGKVDDSIQLFDLETETLEINERFDLAISIEVGEHIPISGSDNYCDNLVLSSDAILFSAAIPGQGGRGHVNEQFIEYWIEKFWQRRYVPLDLVRPYIQSDPKIFVWLKQNLIVFVNFDYLCRRRNLLDSIAPLGSFSRIHQSIYKQRIATS